MRGVSPLIRKKAHTIRNQKTDRPRVRLIDIWKVQLINRSTTDREPDPAVQRNCCTNGCFRSQTPARFRARFPGARTSFSGCVTSFFSTSYGILVAYRNTPPYDAERLIKSISQFAGIWIASFCIQATRRRQMKASFERFEFGRKRRTRQWQLINRDMTQSLRKSTLLSYKL